MARKRVEFLDLRVFRAFLGFGNFPSIFACYHNKTAVPGGSSKMADFFVAPPLPVSRHALVVAPRNRLIFALLKPICVRILHSYTRPTSNNAICRSKNRSIYSLFTGDFKNLIGSSGTSVR